jgi:hypothetical protein
LRPANQSPSLPRKPPTLPPARHLPKPYGNHRLIGCRETSVLSVIE